MFDPNINKGFNSLRINSGPLQINFLMKSMAGFGALVLAMGGVLLPNLGVKYTGVVGLAAAIIGAIIGAALAVRSKPSAG